VTEFRRIMGIKQMEVGDWGILVTKEGGWVFPSLFSERGQGV
jgi:hypothetical protein